MLIETGVQIILSRDIDFQLRPSPVKGFDQRADIEEMALGVLATALGERLNVIWDRQRNAAKTGRRGSARLI